jgi:hypothetical protein
VSSQYIAWTKASNEFQPFDSEHEGYMGNYGNTMDRWYHRAAIILWQRKDHYPILFAMDPASVFSELLKLTRKKFQEAQVSQIISSLLPYWSQCVRRLNGSEICSSVFKIAIYLKDPQLAQSMAIGFDMGALNPERAKLFLSLQEAYGTPWCLNVLQAWSKPKDHWGTAPECKNIAEIIKTLSNSQNHKALSSFLLKYQFAKIIEDTEFYKEYTRANLIAGTAERMKTVMGFIQACIIVNHQLIYTELLNHIMDHVELYPAITLVDITQHLKENLEVYDLKKWHYQKLFNYIQSLLENEKNLGLRKIDDWAIHEKPPCQCEDCGTLGEFLSSAIKTLKWPLGKDRRKHIHNIIEGLSIPVLHQTEHTGSPHKLILTKTDKLYKDAALRFDNLKKALSRLAKLAILRQVETSH